MTLRSLIIRAARKVLLALSPARWRLPIEYRCLMLEGAEPELLHVDKLGPNRGTALDIGANYGFYTYRLAQLYDNVCAFEINPDLTAALAAYGARNIEINNVGLSSEKGELTLYMPIVRGRELVGWASVHKGNCPEAERYIEKPVKVIALDERKLTDVNFIKMDVEGHELSVLSGARETIRRCLPTVLMEIRPDNRGEALAYFTALGYTHRQMGEAADNPNFIFTPPDSKPV